MKGHANRPTEDSHYRGGLFTKTLAGIPALVAEIACAEDAVVDIQFAVTVADLTAFQVRARPHADVAFAIRRSLSAHFVAPTGMILEAGRTGASADLTITPAGESAWLRLDVSGIDAVQIWADGSGSVLNGAYGAN